MSRKNSISSLKKWCMKWPIEGLMQLQWHTYCSLFWLHRFWRSAPHYKYHHRCPEWHSSTWQLATRQQNQVDSHKWMPLPAIKPPHNRESKEPKSSCSSTCATKRKLCDKTVTSVFGSHIDLQATQITERHWKVSINRAHHRHFTRETECEQCTYFSFTSWIQNWPSRWKVPLGRNGSSSSRFRCCQNWFWAALLTCFFSLYMWLRVALYFRIDGPTLVRTVRYIVTSGAHRSRICFVGTWSTYRGISSWRSRDSN